MKSKEHKNHTNTLAFVNLYFNNKSKDNFPKHFKELIAIIILESCCFEA